MLILQHSLSGYIYMKPSKEVESSSGPFITKRKSAWTMEIIIQRHAEVREWGSELLLKGLSRSAFLCKVFYRWSQSLFRVELLPRMTPQFHHPESHRVTPDPISWKYLSYFLKTILHRAEENNAEIALSSNPRADIDAFFSRSKYLSAHVQVMSWTNRYAEPFAPNDLM